MEAMKKLTDLGARLRLVQENKKTLSVMAKEAEAAEKQLKEEIEQVMLEAELKSVKGEFGTLTCGTQIVAKIADLPRFKEFLYSHGLEAIVKEDVHYKTLQTFANELPKDLLEEAHRFGLDYREESTISLRK